MLSKIQAVTISGAIIDKGRWETSSGTTMQVGHDVAVCLYTEDKNLLSHVRKQAKTECSVNAENEKSYVVAVFKVNNIRHMIDQSSDGSSFESMYMIVPISRFVEQIVLYLLEPSKCEIKFVEAIRQG